MSEAQFNKQDSVTKKQRQSDAELDAATHKITALIAGIRRDYETQADEITDYIAGIRRDYEKAAHDDFVQYSKEIDTHIKTKGWLIKAARDDFVQYSKEVDAHIKTKGWLITLIIVLCVETVLFCALIRHAADLIGQQS